MQLHGNDEAIVDSIIDNKVNKGEYKEHPDCPGEESAMLYYVLVDLSHRQEDETEERITVATAATLEGGSEAGLSASTTTLLTNTYFF